MMLLLVMFHLSPSSCLWSDQHFCLVYKTYESICLEYLDEFVVDPLDDIVIFSMLDKIHIESLALTLETFENRLRVISKYVF